MNKHIGTLVGDIQALLVNPRLDRELVAGFSRSLSEKLVDRLCEGPQTPRLRPSNFSNGDRKLWYAVRHPELGAELEPEARQKFLYGDVIEEELLFLAEAAGHEVIKDIEVSYEGISGRIDAIIDGVLVDVKSASGRGFYKFANHELESNDPFGYLDQLSLYLLGLQGDARLKVKGQAAFLVCDKENGRLCLDIYSLQKKDYKAEIVRKAGVIAGDKQPDRCHDPVPYGSSGNQRLSVECQYCPFKKDCWKESNGGKGIRSFIYSSGVVELVRVQREPEVKEIT